MQLSLARFIVIVSLLISVLRTEYREEYRRGVTLTDDPIDEMAHDEAFLESNADESQAGVAASRKKRQAARNSRTTYVKAILSNPKLSASQHMAQKLAQAELKSPKMQETFKKLTAVHAPRQNWRGMAGIGEVSAFARSPYKAARSGRPRKRKRKRHKSRRRNGLREINASRGKASNYRVRLTRQTANSSAKFRDHARNRRGKSNQFYAHELLDGLEKNQNSVGGPTANLGLETLDTDLGGSGLERNPLNYVPNYSPMADQSENLENLDPPAEENQDFRSPNDPSAGNRFVSANDDSYLRNLEREKLNGLENDRSRERQNAIWRSKQYVSGDPNRIDTGRYVMPDGVNSRSASKAFGYQNFAPSRLNAANNFRNSENFNYDQYGRGARLYPRYRSGSMNPAAVGRLAQRSEILSSEMNAESKTDDLVKPAGKALRRDPMIGSFGNSKQQGRRASRVEKSEESIDKSVSGTGESCTTTEMNPKLKGIGEASAVPPEMVEKMPAKSKSLKGTEYHLLPMNTAGEPQAAMAKSSEIQLSNSSDVANETKEVAGQILNKIIEELEDLKLDRTKNDQKEGLPCRLSGSWITTQAGVRIDMLVTNRTVNVSMAKLSLPVGVSRQSLLNYTWNITGYAPFKRGGPFSLTATDNHTKSVAVFVGACRVCQGVDTIEGVWSVAREPRDCRDFQVATSIYNDIFRRTRLLTAIKERQLEMTSTTKCTSTASTPAPKEDDISSVFGGNKIA